MKSKTLGLSKPFHQSFKTFLDSILSSNILLMISMIKNKSLSQMNRQTDINEYKIFHNQRSLEIWTEILYKCLPKFLEYRMLNTFRPTYILKHIYIEMLFSIIIEPYSSANELNPKNKCIWILLLTKKS